MTERPDFSSLAEWRLLQAGRNVARAERRVVQAGQKAAQAEDAAKAAALAAEDALQRERDRAAVLQAQLDQLLASTSWRVSHPVRVASRLRQVLRPPPPVALPPSAAPQPLPDRVAPLPPREQAILQRLLGPGRD